MAKINSTWSVVSKVKFKMATGHSVRSSILESCKTLENSFEQKLFLWAQRYPHPFPDSIALTSTQVVVMNLLNEGLKGKPIYEPLKELEMDVRDALLVEIQEHIDKLPFLSLIPMLFFIGPSLFLILVGPLLYALIQELSV